EFISTILDPPIGPGLDPEQVLAGNFAPVNELPPTACHVASGALPACLDGAYIRNGPNPQFGPRGSYHLFDGDGMLHAIKISKGEATFCSRYVKTYKYVTEHNIGYPIFPSIFSSFNGFKASVASSALFFARLLSGQINPKTHGFGLANTSVAHLCGQLYALGESDLPYAIRLTPDGDIITLGRRSFESEPFRSMTAHPKTDPDTGELFAFRYFGTHPYLTFFRIDPDGTKQRDVPIFSMEAASMVHDFAVTKGFVVFPDTQIMCNLWHVIRGKSIIGFNPDKVPRLGVIPRYAEDESDMYWIDVPGLNMVHVVNAWDEDDGETIVIMAANALSFEHILEQMHLVHISLERVEIDTKAKKVVMRRQVSARSLEFGVINPQYTAKKNRYIYAAEMESMPKIAGVVKVDLSLFSDDGGGDCVEDGIVASRIYGPGCYGGEPFFVPREPDNPDADEDDGYLVTYVHNENTEKSNFIVMDAKSPNLDIVADVMLPARVPYGFHGMFVKENDLNVL
ncbi:probable carotenoid cleavage dioxygenase 4 chloroplastic, partial [Phtheirospermum japonicum]